MRIRAWESVCALFLGAAMANTVCIWFTDIALAHPRVTAASTRAGVWQGESQGAPGVVLTLAQESGTLEGTLVLNFVRHNGGRLRAIAHEAHVLMRVRIQGGSLIFQVKRVDGAATPIEFTAEQTLAHRAKVHCLNCGNETPTVEIIKAD